MVNTYISDVFFNMNHGSDGHYPDVDDNAEMLISMLIELGADSWNIPTVEELRADFFSRL